MILNEQKSQITDHGSMINPFVSSSLVSSCLRGKKLEVRSEKLEESGSAALHNSSNSYLLTSNFSPSSSPLLITHYSLFIENRRRGFTLMEMIVAMSILVVMMGAVGEIFQLASHAVRVGQGTLGVMANVRAAESQIRRDIHHIDSGSYLIIRQTYYAPLWQTGVQYEPGDEVQSGGSYYLCRVANTSTVAPTTTSTNWQVLTAPNPLIWRADQISFIAHGQFHGRTGSYPGGTLSATDGLTSNSAAIWYGQFSASYGSKATPGGMGSAPAEQTPYWPQDTAVTAGQPPSGQTAGQYFFGREALLFDPSITSTPYEDTNFQTFGYPSSISYPGSFYSTTASVTPTGETAAAITSSRLDAVGGSPAMVDGFLSRLPDTSTNLQTIADDYCYRFSTLVSPQASNQPATFPLNGYFRMTPIMLQGVSSFAVDWTDGTYTTGTTPPLLNWYGVDNTLTFPVGLSYVQPTTNKGTYVFYSQNRQYWPKALRITYTITDPANRLQGGNAITQVVRLPQ